MSNYLFGVATSSHQNEGNNFLNNWWEWEIKNNLERSGIACNSWLQWKDDIDCIKELGCNAYRFSIEWSRIFIDEDQVDKSALKKYEQIVDYCLENGIEPLITLHHFTRPYWFDNKYGGLHNRKILKFFKKYVKTVCKKFGKKVKWWITYNEPMLECVNGYIRGTRPPGKVSDFNSMYLAILNIIDSHCLAYKMIKRYNPDAKVSMAKNMVDFEKRYYYDVIKSRIEDQIIENFNFGILDAFYKGYFNFGLNIANIGIKNTKRRSEWIGKLDYLGLNHYNVGYVDISYTMNNPANVLLTMDDNKYLKNRLNWDFKPNSLQNVLNSLKNRYGNLDIIITESGSCQGYDDPSGCKIQENVLKYHFNTSLMNHQTIGYFFWTLVDNFEWDDGWLPKFGLFRLEKKHGTRTVRVMKDSGKQYKMLISKYRTE